MDPRVFYLIDFSQNKNLDFIKCFFSFLTSILFYFKENKIYDCSLTDKDSIIEFSKDDFIEKWTYYVRRFILQAKYYHPINKMVELKFAGILKQKAIQNNLALKKFQQKKNLNQVLFQNLV